MYAYFKIVPGYLDWWGAGTIFSGWSEMFPGNEFSLLRFLFALKYLNVVFQLLRTSSKLA